MGFDPITIDIVNTVLSSFTSILNIPYFSASYNNLQMIQIIPLPPKNVSEWSLPSEEDGQW